MPAQLSFLPSYQPPAPRPCVHAASGIHLHTPYVDRITGARMCAGVVANDEVILYPLSTRMARVPLYWPVTAFIERFQLEQ